MIFAQAPGEEQRAKHQQAAIKCLKEVVRLGGSLDSIREEPWIDEPPFDKELAELLKSSQPIIAEPVPIVLPCADPVLR
jgi:hypothetical protein